MSVSIRYTNGKTIGQVLRGRASKHLTKNRDRCCPHLVLVLL